MNHIFDLTKVGNYRKATCPTCGSVCIVKGNRVFYKNAFGFDLNRMPPCIPDYLVQVKRQKEMDEYGIGRLDENAILLKLVHDEILPYLRFEKNSVQGNIVEKLRREVKEYF